MLEKFFKRLLPDVAKLQNPDINQCVPTPPNPQAIFGSNADARRFHVVTAGDSLYFFGLRRRNQDSRRAFVKQQEFRPKFSDAPERLREIHAASHASERAFSQRDSQAAIAQVVR